LHRRAPIKHSSSMSPRRASRRGENRPMEVECAAHGRALPRTRLGGTPLNRFAPLAITAALLTLSALPLAAQAPALKTTEFGRGPTVVLVHGLGSGRMQWMPTARKLLAGYHVVMVDLPGHGDSAMPDPFTLNVAAAALDQVLARQKAESTIVVGQGMGGSIAVLAVQAHPEHVRGVIAIDATL